MCTYVQTWPKRREHCYDFYKLSYKNVDVIQLGIFSKNPHRLVYFLLKNATVFFHGPLFHHECEENIWKTFLPAFWRA